MLAMPQTKLRDHETWEALGELLAHSRARIGYTQTEAGQSVGLTRNQLASVERGERRPTPAELRGLFALYGLNDDADPRPWSDLIADLGEDDARLLRTIATIMLADTRPA